eukprot:COSAG04_NODE_4128_length_2280_cov_1.422742_3_plen_70_part_00
MLSVSLTLKYHYCSQYHFHIETQSVVAVPMEDDGLRLHSATQCASTVQTAVAAAIGVQQNKVIVETKRW